MASFDPVEHYARLCHRLTIYDDVLEALKQAKKDTEHGKNTAMWLRI